MAYETIILTKEEGIATITLNRPQVHNAFNRQLRGELRAVSQEIGKDKEIRVAIVTGAGDKAFCSGRDLKEYSARRGSPIEEWQTRIEEDPGSFGIGRIPQPVIAAINGYAIAGGLEVALACDIRIASEKATFGLFEIRRGFFPGGGGIWRPPFLIGKGWTMELVLGGDTITAQVAERIGLVNRVVPHEELMNVTRELAQKIASRSPAGVMLAKAAINQVMEPLERMGANLSTALRCLAETNEDIMEGIKDFSEKRERS